MKRENILKKIQVKEKKRKAVLISLLKTPSMIRGAFHKSLTKCGRVTCRCQSGEGHPCFRICWTEKAKARTKSIPQEERSWAEKQTKNYKAFRKNRQMLKKLDNEIKALMDLLEREMVIQTWVSNKGVVSPYVST